MKNKFIFIVILTIFFIYACGEDNRDINTAIQSVIDNSTEIENSNNNDINSNNSSSNDENIKDNTDNNSSSVEDNSNTIQEDTSSNTANPEQTAPDNSKPQPNPPSVNHGVCRIILDGNGGTGGDDGYYIYKSMDMNQTTDLPINNFTNGDYEFLGWSYKKDAIEADFFDGAMFKVEKDTTLYAVWAPKDEVYVVNIKTYNDTNSMPKKLSVRKGGYVILPLILSTKKGFMTIGYSKQNSIMEAELHEGDKFYPENNTTLYVIYSDGRCISCAGKTMFIKGVKVNSSDWETKFTYRSEPPAGMPLRYKTAVWHEDSNWYSVNQYRYNMCWAAAASNMLLWWKYNNKKYIDKYLETNTYEGAKFTYYYDKWFHKGHSDLFEKEFIKYWANDGNYTTLALDWFLKGDKEHQAGGYFKEVFENKNFSYIVGNTDKTRFNYFLTQVIKNNQIAGLHIKNPGDHIVTFWGADYDDEGFIKAVYTTNSQVDGRTVNDNSGGLEVDYINYSEESKFPLLNDTKVPVMNLHVFSLGEDIWKEYFKNKGITFPEDEVE